MAIDRWVENLFFLRESEAFYVPAGFDWDSITVFSIAVKSYPDNEIIDPDSGTVSFRNFRGDDFSSWERIEMPEILVVSQDTLDRIAENAAAFILGRQEATGLLTTWEEDHSSWLYGQGLALKALVLEGVWENNTPVNSFAVAAQKLAGFLAGHQNADGSWTRAWNKARDFLLSLIEPDGKFFTVNKITGGKEEVTSGEAYVAAIAALLETGDEDRANAMIDYLENRTWNPDFRCWDEGFYSDRVVLFANTWMAGVLYERGYAQKAMDALSLAGRLLFTSGPGKPGRDQLVVLHCREEVPLYTPQPGYCLHPCFC